MICVKIEQGETKKNPTELFYMAAWRPDGVQKQATLFSQAVQL